MREHSSCVLAYAFHRGASASEAEDVVAEVFLVCWRRIDEVPDRALPWLFGVARKVLANRRRSQHRREALQARLAQNASSLTAAWSYGVGDAEVFADVLHAFARLDETDREALLLVGWDGLSQKEAAQALGCSRAALSVRLHRARARLMKSFEDIRTFNEQETNAAEGTRRE